MRLTHCLASGLAFVATAWAQAKGLPPGVEAALARARIPADAVTLLVTDADGKAPARLSHRTDVPFNPASVMKLVTTYAALDQLGPAFAWRTPVYVDGPVRDGVLQGNLYLRGQGDPKLVVERLWLLLRRVQGLGIHRIAGDIVLDHGAFDVAPQDPGRFDGEPLRPYNAAPDALLVNYKSVVMTFVPDRTAASAAVQAEPPLAGVQFPSSVAMAVGDCGDWRGTLKADFGDPLRVRFNGSFPAACGEKVWPLAYVDPSAYAARAVAGLWAQLGGTLTGQVRDGSVPAGLTPALEAQSPPLAEVVRDINKYSNNVMAQQLFLTLSLQQKGLGTLAGSRELLAQWWHERLGDVPAPVMDNGSGLSRDARITARSLGRLLQLAWASPLMPELASSLPISGVDGTLRRSRSAATAHLKTGSLRDVAGVAGFVLGASGRRHVLVALVNHPNAAQSRPVFDALVDWAASDL
ncbi:MAG: D-alanyl-D-alanine carboxypeptidase/D-alanyl-D-alanine-endopeptidase [Ramlibacter sp.]|nr:D-alanyl-D-alanine carboxypeptidase/D-alanyl-D-alanine-endopeptidase [Ramlibacter sp.]